MNWPVSEMCAALKVTRQGYCAWKSRPPSAHAMRDGELVEPMSRVGAEVRNIYGAPKAFMRLRALGCARPASCASADGAASRACAPKGPRARSGPRGANRRRTRWGAGSGPTAQTWRSSPTSPRSRRARAGCTRRSRRAYGRAALRAGRWGRTSRPSWPTTR